MKKYIVVVVMFCFLAYLAHLYGIKIIGKDFAKNINRVQAEMALNTLGTYQNIESELKMGCKGVALKRLSNLIDQKTMLLAEYVQSGSSENIERLIHKRDSELLQKLKSYKINWDKKYIVPHCESGD